MSYSKPQLMLLAIIAAVCRRTKAPEVRYLPSREVVICGINPLDEGRIIGKKGTVFRAITVLHFYACRSLRLEQCAIQPLATSEHGPVKETTFLPKMEWDKTRITTLIESILSVCFPTAAWVMEREGEDITARIQISKSLKPDPLDPSFETALDTVIHGAGKSCGAEIHTQITWI